MSKECASVLKESLQTAYGNTSLDKVIDEILSQLAQNREELEVIKKKNEELDTRITALEHSRNKDLHDIVDLICRSKERV